MPLQSRHSLQFLAFIAVFDSLGPDVANPATRVREEAVDLRNGFGVRVKLPNIAAGRPQDSHSHDDSSRLISITPGTGRVVLCWA